MGCCLRGASISYGLPEVVDCMGDGDRIDAIVISFSKAFDLVPHDRLLMKIANLGVDSRVVAFVGESLLGCKQGVRVGGHYQRKLKCGVPQRNILGPVLFLAFTNDIWRIIGHTIRLFTDNCVIYKKKYQ
jgi:hypothetical protein